VTADPGHLLFDSQVAKKLGLRLPDNGPLPLRVLTQASTYLAKNLISAHVSGTWRSPIVQIRPAPVLTEEAIRFFTQVSGP
jgi:hypothetical protein